MENSNENLYVREEDQEIDLIELCLYVCRKWRVLLLLGLIGILIGCGVGCRKGFVYNAKTKKDFWEKIDPSELKKVVQLEQIESYAKLLSVVEAAKEEARESLYLNLDSQNTYVARIEYIFQVKNKDVPVISRIYDKVLNNEENMTQLIAASGINECTLQDMRKMISLYVSVSEVNNLTEFEYAPNRIVTARVIANVLMPNQESCARILETFDGQIQNMNKTVESTYNVSFVEKIVKAPEKEISIKELQEYKDKFSEKLREDAETLKTLENKLTKDDLAYIQAIYGEKEETVTFKSLLKTALKWAILLCIAFGALGVMGFAAVFLLDGHVKNVDELLAYGLYPVAVLEENKNIKLNAIDKLFVAKRHYQTDEYLASSLNNLGAEKMILCGDLEDNDIREHAEKAVKICGKFSLGDRMIQNADVQQTAKQADGVVLFVHLWKTKRIDLEQELRICQKIGAKLLGVAVIG